MKHAWLVVAVSLSLVAVARTQSRENNARTRDIYVSAVDSKGAPVPDLGVTDFSVREDGVSREGVKVEPATKPLQIVLPVDDSQASEPAIQPLREGLPKFVDALAGKADIGIVTVGERPTSVVEHTTDTAALKKGITRIFARPGSGAYLLDGILDVLKGLKKREVARPHIVVITMEATEFSTLQSQTVLDQLYPSGVTLHVLSVGQPLAGLDDESRNKNQVVAEGTEKTGGRRDQLLSVMGIPDGLAKVANDLLHQYVVTYGRPEALIPPARIQVTSPRQGVTVRARTRLTGK